MCAQAKAQRRGLRSNLVIGDVYEDYVLLCAMVEQLPDEFFDDEDNNDSSDDGDDEFRLEIEYTSHQPQGEHSACSQFRGLILINSGHLK